MNMGIPNAWTEEPARTVYFEGSVRSRNACGGAHGGNAITCDYNRLITLPPCLDVDYCCVLYRENVGPR
jgi:hypothetical protein